MSIAIFYTLFFLVLIRFLPLFSNKGINRTAFSLAFLIKVFAGFSLTYIYTYYYPDRSTADIYKYYDDAKILYNAWYQHPLDYVKMLCGVGNDNDYFYDNYYSKMNHWCRRYDFGTYNDNHTIIRFNALVMFISFGSFHVHTVVMCFVSFLGLTSLYLVFCKYFESKRKLIYLVVFFIPSLVFWGSGVLKEGLLLFAIGFFIYTYIKIFIEKKAKFVYVVLFLFTIILQLINKNYLLIVLSPALFCFWVIEQFKIKRVILFYLGFYTLLFFGAILATQLMAESPLQALVDKRRDFMNLAQGGVFIMNEKVLVRVDPENKFILDTIHPKKFRIKSGSAYMYWDRLNFNDTLYVKNSTDTSSFDLIWDLPVAGSAISVSPMQASIGSLIAHIPEALCISSLQPSIFQANSITEKMAAIENTIFILILIISLLFSNFKTINKNWLCLCIAIVVVLYLIIGFTTPVAGAIVRYKIPALPFFLMIAINLIDSSKFKKMPIARHLF